MGWEYKEVDRRDVDMGDKIIKRKIEEK